MGLDKKIKIYIQRASALVEELQALDNKYREHIINFKQYEKLFNKLYKNVQKIFPELVKMLNEQGNIEIGKQYNEIFEGFESHLEEKIEEEELFKDMKEAFKF